MRPISSATGSVSTRSSSQKSAPGPRNPWARRTKIAGRCITCSAARIFSTPTPSSPTPGPTFSAGSSRSGSIPDIDKIPREALPSVLANLRKSLESVFGRGYFITKYMMADLKQTQLNGTLPVLYVFLARRLHHRFRHDGRARSRGQTCPGGQRDDAGREDRLPWPKGREQTLYYFASNLADSAIKANPGFVKFCEQQGQGVSFLKAAAYLMAPDNFLRWRAIFSLAYSKLILQDESGIPHRFIEPQKWDIRIYAKTADLTKPTRRPSS